MGQAGPKAAVGPEGTEGLHTSRGQSPDSHAGDGRVERCQSSAPSGWNWENAWRR